MSSGSSEVIFDKRFKTDLHEAEARPDGARPFLGNTGGAGDLIGALGFVLGYQSIGISSWVWNNRDDYTNLMGVLLTEPRTSMDDLVGCQQLGGRAFYYESFLRGGYKDHTFIEWISKSLPGNPPWIKPAVGHLPESLEWAAQVFRDGGGHGKKVMVFPYAAWGTRSWPLAYWADLCWGLKYAGHTPISYLPSGQDGHHKCLPFSLWGTNWSQTAALIQEADLVIANDSGPAHLAGVMGKPTIAICGPTRRVFEHLPSVMEITLSPEELGCIGCWFDAEGGFRSSCDNMCRGLATLNPETVTEYVLSTLEGEEFQGVDRVPLKVMSAMPHLTEVPHGLGVPITVNGVEYV